LEGYVFILVLLALMWFMLIRPQRRRQAEAQRLVNQLLPGKEIVTAGGLYGTVTEVHEDEVRIEVAKGVQVRIAKRAVAAIVSEEAEEPFEVAAEPDEETPATLPSRD
jgi:preprotein translocase subunit YajC